MNEIIKQLVKILLTKEYLVGNSTISFTSNLKDIIDNYNYVSFDKDSANTIFEILDTTKVRRFNLTLTTKQKSDGFNWSQSNYIFYGDDVCISVFECLSNISGFRMDDYNRLIKDKSVEIENLSEHIDLLIELDSMLNEQRKSVLEHIKKLN